MSRLPEAVASCPSRPLVSVVIPVYNGERFVGEALASVFAQTYRPIEVVVVDDGSTDDSAAVAASFAEVRVLSQPNGGVAAARNTGIRESRGELVAFLDQDDLWEPRKIEAQVEALRRHPEAQYVLTRDRFVLEPGTPRPKWLRPRNLNGEFVAFEPSAVLVRRAAFVTVGLFDPAYRMASDSDWFFRAKDIGVERLIVEETLVVRRIHRANASSDAATGATELRRIAMASVLRQRQRQAAQQRPDNGGDP